MLSRYTYKTEVKPLTLNIFIMLKLEIIGNLGADAVVQDYNGEKFCSFRVAHTTKYTDRSSGEVTESTQWVSVTISRDVTTLLPYLKKGTKVWVYGDASTRMYVGHDGQKHAGLNLRAQSLELCGSREPSPMEIVTRLAEDAEYNAAYMAAYSEYKRLHPESL